MADSGNRRLHSKRHRTIVTGEGGDCDAVVVWELPAPQLTVTVAQPGFVIESVVTLTTTPSVEKFIFDLDAIPVAVTTSVEAFVIELTQAVITTPSVEKFVVDMNAVPVTITPSADYSINLTQGVAVTPSIDYVGITHTKTVTISVSAPRFVVPSLLAMQDTWVPELAVCADDTNKNGTNLEVDGVVATRKDSYFEFNTKKFRSAGGTVTFFSASVTIYVTTAPVADSPATLAYRFDAGVWNETTLTCSNAPMSGSSFTTSFTVPAGFTGNLNIPLTGSQLTNLAGDINANRDGTFSIVGGAAAVPWDFQSTDSGGSPGNASGPRLALDFQVA